MKKISILLLICTIVLFSGQLLKAQESEQPKRALFVVTNHGQLGETGKETGWFLSEVAHPYYVLTEAGFEIDFVSPKGGKAPMDERSRDTTDAENKRFLNDKELMATMNNTMKPSDVNAEDYSVIFYAGGHGTMWDFPNSDPLAAIAAAIYEQGGIIAAVCHGPSALINIKLSGGKPLLEGKTVACFTNEEEAAVELTEAVPFLLETKLKACGAEFTKADKFQEHVVVSDRLVTGQNPASAKKLGETIVNLHAEKM